MSEYQREMEWLGGVMLRAGLVLAGGILLTLGALAGLVWFVSAP